MNFYNVLANVYDDIFDLRPQVLKFINKGLNKNDKVLNLSCATGIYDVELLKNSIEVVSIDVRESMILQYEKKINLNKIEYYNEDMRNINILFKEDKFKKIFCIDNSISYLDSYWDFKDLSKKIKNILEKEGTFILVLNNYDKLLMLNNFEMPLISNNKKKISLKTYFKNIKKHSIELNSILKISKGEIELNINKTFKIIPLTKDIIYDILNEVGYFNIKVYGDFYYNPWSEESELTIIEAHR